MVPGKIASFDNLGMSAGERTKKARLLPAGLGSLGEDA